jgi:hypothetical protein
MLGSSAASTVARISGWAVVTVILGGLFVGVTLALQTLVAPLTGSNELAVAGSTLRVAALFQPLRGGCSGSSIGASTAVATMPSGRWPHSPPPARRRQTPRGEKQRHEGRQEPDEP